MTETHKIASLWGQQSVASRPSVSEVGGRDRRQVACRMSQVEEKVQMEELEHRTL
jgi:hypothetical protein